MGSVLSFCCGVCGMCLCLAMARGDWRLVLGSVGAMVLCVLGIVLGEVR